MAGTHPKTTIKSGIVLSGSFSGNPKTYTVSFSAAYPDNNYSIELCGVDARSWTYSKNPSGVGFTINSNANTALTGEVSWRTVYAGEQL